MKKAAFLISIVAVAAALLGWGRTATADTDSSGMANAEVPNVAGKTLALAYSELRAVGLRVTIADAFSTSSFCQPRVRAQEPRAGASVRRGATVVLRPAVCRPISPAVSPGTAVVPTFIGRPARDLVTWARDHEMFWFVRDAPPIYGAAKPALLDNFDITRQWPAAGRNHQRSAPAPHTPPGSSGRAPVPVIVWVQPTR